MQDKAKRPFLYSVRLPEGGAVVPELKVLHGCAQGGIVITPVKSDV